MRPLALALPILLLACHGSTTRHEPDTHMDDSGIDDTGDTGTPPVEGCRATPLAADRDRLVVASYPYTAAGGAAQAWQIFTLTADGELTTEGERFDLGRGYDGRVAFTPDGSVGLAVNDDGTLGAFEALSASAVRVIEARYDGGFYASSVMSDPSGEWAWVVDGNWANNGGGLYRVPISCEDGSLGVAERVLEAKLPAHLLRLHRRPERAVLVGREAGGVASGDDVYLVEPGSPTAVLAGADAFGDDEAIFAGAALTADDAWVLVGDNSAFSGIANRVAVVAVGDGVLTPAQVMEVDDPVDILTSPFGDSALVVSGYSNAVVVLSATGEAAAPFTLAGEPEYVGASPQLPAAADLVSRGSLKGLVVLSENQGLRRMLFEAGGVADLGLESYGGGLEYIPGAVGVQP
ncbi:MAG: hypothetical protein ABIO70_08715 [Pseudomonadota bacterium]